MGELLSPGGGGSAAAGAAWCSHLGYRQGAWGSRGRNVPLAVADGMRKVLLGKQATPPAAPPAPQLGLAALAPGGVMPSTGCCFISCSSLHASKLLKGSEGNWLEHVIQSGWTNHHG